MSSQPENLSQSAEDEFDQDEEQRSQPLELLYLDADILPSGRDHNDKFWINSHTIDGVRSRGPAV